MLQSKQLIKICSFFALFLFAPEIFAGIFDPPPTDKSVRILGQIFGSQIGGVYLGGQTNVALMEMFEKFNIVIVSIGVIILSYIAILSTINTAQEGQVMGKKWSSVWLPMRSLVGMLLMVPTPGTGYSMMQATVMWVILQGVGAADQLWNVVLDSLEQGVSASVGTQVNHEQLRLIAGPTKELTRDLMRTAVCMEVLHKLGKSGTIDSSLPGFASAATAGMPVSQFIKDSSTSVRPYVLLKEEPPTNILTSASYRGEFNIGIKANSDFTQTMCGGYKIEATVTKGDLKNTENMSEAEITENIKKLAEQAYNKKQLALMTMLSYLRVPAKKIADESMGTRTKKSSDGPNGRLKEGVEANYLGYTRIANEIYLNTMSELVDNSSANQNQDVKSAIVKGKQTGWISAGAFYFVLNQSTTKSLIKTAVSRAEMPKINPLSGSNADSVPSCKGMKDPNECYDSPFRAKGLTSLADNLPEEYELKYIAGIFSDTERYLEASKDLDNRGVDSSRLDFGSKAGGEESNQLSILNEKLMTGIKNAIGDNGDPLLSLSRIGSIFMLTAEVTWFIYIGFSIAMILAVSAGGTSPLGAGAGAAIAMTQFSNLLGSLLLPVLFGLWTIGATISIYLPMVPYMMFTLAAVGWIILVIEAIVAAPIFSLALVVPSGDEMGKAITGIGILAGIILRPSLMIVGFILAIRLFKAVISLVNFGMMDAMKSVTASGSLLSAFPAAALYVGLLVASVNKCFSLIYVLPDRLLRWIGIAPESTDVSEMEKAKGAMDTVAKGTAGAMAGSAQATGSQASTSVGDAAKKQEEDKKNNSGEGSEVKE